MRQQTAVVLIAVVGALGAMIGAASTQVVEYFRGREAERREAWIEYLAAESTSETPEQKARLIAARHRVLVTGNRRSLLQLAEAYRAETRYRLARIKLGEVPPYDDECTCETETPESRASPNAPL